MISSFKNIKKVLFMFTSLLVLFCFTSCNKTPDITSNSNESGNLVENSNTNSDDKQNESEEITDDEKSTDNETENSNVDVKDNPGDDGYSWSPGEH